jgi:signal transduction histidine kinase/CheY-like chemotaxis protein
MNESLFDQPHESSSSLNDQGTENVVKRRIARLEEELRCAHIELQKTACELNDARTLLQVTQEQLAITREEKLALDIGHQHTENQLHNAARYKDAYLTMLAHELRNPLAPLRNAVEVMRSLHVQDPKLVELREIIDRQVEHMARMLDGLLDISHIASNKLQLQQEEVDLAALYGQTVEDFRSIMESMGRKLIMSAPEEPLWVWGDPTRLMQILSNLLRNALKFTQAGDQINIAMFRKGNAVTVRVSDTGIGMPPELVAHTFDPFRQGEGPNKRPGLGLGLTLVKGLVELHGGSVQATSRGPGQGSEFCIHLFLTHQKSDGLAKSPIADSPSTSLRILVIDDLRDTADTLQLLLEHEGHRVAVAYDGEQALSIARQFVPQAVLCDIDLTDAMDGYAIARALRRDPILRTAHLIAVTGYGHEQNRIEAYASGFDDHLLKPVSVETLTAVLAAGRKE